MGGKCAALSERVQSPRAIMMCMCTGVALRNAMAPSAWRAMLQNCNWERSKGDRRGRTHGWGWERGRGRCRCPFLRWPHTVDGGGCFRWRSDARPELQSRGHGCSAGRGVALREQGGWMGRCRNVVDVVVLAETGHGRRRWLNGRHSLQYTSWCPLLLTVWVLAEGRIAWG